MVLRLLDKVEIREPSPFSCWAVTLPEQPPCLLLLLHQLSGDVAGWAESSKAGRLSSPDTRSLGTPPKPTPPNLTTPLAPGSQARSLALSLGPQQKPTVLRPPWNVTAQTGHSPDKQARAEVRLLQRAGLHLRRHRQHLAGQGGHRPVSPCSGGGGAPAAPGGSGGDAGDWPPHRSTGPEPENTCF